MWTPYQVLPLFCATLLSGHFHPKVCAMLKTNVRSMRTPMLIPDSTSKENTETGIPLVAVNHNLKDCVACPCCPLIPVYSALGIGPKRLLLWLAFATRYACLFIGCCFVDSGSKCTGSGRCTKIGVRGLPRCMAMSPITRRQMGSESSAAFQCRIWIWKMGWAGTFWSANGGVENVHRNNQQWQRASNAVVHAMLIAMSRRRSVTKEVGRCH